MDRLLEAARTDPNSNVLPFRGAADDPVGWLGRYGNEHAQSERIDALLAEGFGR